MAVPKRKTSKQRKHKRAAANWTATAPTLVECPQCHEMKVAHKVCDACGYYDGQQVVEVSADKK